MMEKRIEAALNGSFDLIILDVMLQLWMVLKSVVQFEKKQTPIMIVSAKKKILINSWAWLRCG